MGKKKASNIRNADLGRSLIKEKNAERRGHGLKATSWLHTSGVQDGYDWNRLNLQSVTEQNTLEEFLETAEMAGVEFKAEKLNIKIVGTGTVTGVLGESEKARIKKLQEENCKFVTIPRRPAWDETTSPEQLALKEREAFLNWRRTLSLLQEEKGLLLTPYEKNLDVWRQLWRVVERSDVVCQIVDARNPLLYKTDDLESYVKEVNPSKKFLILVNKADYLTKKQRNYWLSYFKMINTKVIFWSALEEIESKVNKECTKESPEIYKDNQSLDEMIFETDSFKKNENDTKDLLKDSDDLFRTSQLISYFKTFKKVVDGSLHHENYVTIGLVGYPNVGKSSTINALLREKKTAVSATPGKTKHFQTHFLDESLCLCDCPGLVFPTFISSKADMVLNGILPIDQLRDYVTPTTILAQLIPRVIIENIYGINIPKPAEGEDPNRPPTAEELLSSYGKMRGFMTANGLPDCPRTSRYILKDFINGKLLYCYPPPGVSHEGYEPCVMSEKVQQKVIAREEKNKKLQSKQQSHCISHIDEEFFSEKTPGFGFKAPISLLPNAANSEQYLPLNKSWKKHGTNHVKFIYNINVMNKRKLPEKRVSCCSDLADGDLADCKKKNKEVDSEEDLPSIFPITKSKNGFSKGEVIFVKFKKYPYWPAVFCKNASRTKGTSLHAYVHFFEVATENCKNLIKVPIKNIKYFNCSDREEIITVGSLLDDFKFGMDQAEEYLRKRALGKIPSFFDQTDTDKLLEDVNDSIINQKNKKEENQAISVKRVADNTELMKSIKLTRVTLRNIAVGVESSIRHNTFTKGTRREKANLKWKAGYGPLNDNESDEILETLLNWFKEDFDDLPYNPISYVSDVWLPEAIIRGIAIVNNLNLKDAEELYLH